MTHHPRKPGLRSRLLAMSCLAGVVCSVALSGAETRAATTTTTPPKRHATSSTAATSAAHAPAAPAAHAATAAHPVTPRAAAPRTTVARAASPEDISVVSSRQALNGGGGMMRLETAPHTVQTVAKEYIDMRAPTSTALDLIKNLPSLSVSTPDTGGMQGGMIEVRGLTDLDMGLMVDGAPAAAAKYMAEDIDSENLEEVNVTPGSSGIDLPVMSAAGGVMNEQSHIASHKAGGLMDFSYGTNNLSREFLRLESGDIGNSGVRAYVSFSNTHDRAWMGAGINERHHLDFGVQKDWANGSTAKVFVSWNNENFTIDNYPTAQEFYTFKHTGQGWGRSANPSDDNYWKNNKDHWNQVFLTAPLHIVLPARFSFDLQPYFSFGQGWDASPGGVVDGVNQTSFFLQNATRQVGAVTKLGYQIDPHNAFSLGYWYENNYTDQSYPSGATNADGTPPSPWYLYKTTSPYGQNAGYELHSLFLQDTAKYLHDKLVIHAGFKFVMANTWTADPYNRYSTNTTEPLPQLSIGYTFNEHHQIYVNAEGDYRQPSAVDMGWLPTAPNAFPKNQYSIKEELGYRYHDKYVIVDLALFNYNVTNRIVNQYIGYNSFKPISIGNQTMRGFDLMVSGRSIHGFSPYASIEYLNARQDSNVMDLNEAVPTLIHSKGTQAVMAPHVMANFGLTYTYKGFFANGSVHYTGAQSVSVAGDQRMPGYVTNTLSLGYHFKPFMFAKSPTFRLNFTNLTGSIVRTGPMGVVYRATDQNANTTGTGNSFMVEPRFTMTGTVSTAF
ncbi:TonB-dependent receptor [Gluconacetobacter diazotrophicus]|uniref:TonB-dependent receptor n=1 Tax=Gluconacetobacter diazotrophicus (strain ATCC 49037 / DSM 5601 / CCUG 37298 / CIP 103539 / LMG 7603 / PAl5) TaxID=272568 RepID=A9HFL0_GLUDA|nr:TonB-dependent receptor [Gluconacetobacter diazotrophicus]CAP55377.1 TonB-dependent receptor [Gluconacetobacter diazotrophicus PA1 5]